MPVDQSSKKKVNVASRLFTAMAGMFTKTIVPTAINPFRRGKYANGRVPRGTCRRSRMRGPSGTSGGKIRRAIRRGNHGLVNKHGSIGAAIAEEQREKWLLAHNKPVIALSTSI